MPWKDWLEQVAVKSGGSAITVTSGGETLRFERFELDMARRQVRVSGVPVALGARAFDVLAALMPASA